MDKKLERSYKEKVLRKLAKKLKPVGFERTKPTFFTRSLFPVVEFLHLHKFTFDSSFRVHMGLRVVSDPFVAVALNGPDSDAFRSPNSPNGKQYNFGYHDAEETVECCALNVAAFIEEVAEPWFQSWSDRAILASSRTSPLDLEAKVALRRALLGELDETHVAKTKELLHVP